MSNATIDLLTTYAVLATGLLALGLLLLDLGLRELGPARWRGLGPAGLLMAVAFMAIVAYRFAALGA